MPASPTDSLLGRTVLYLLDCIRAASAFYESFSLSSFLASSRLLLEGAVEDGRDYIMSVDLSDDAKLSLQIGCALGVCVVTFLVMYPGEPFDYSKVDGGKEPKKQKKGQKKKDGSEKIVRQRTFRKKAGKKDGADQEVEEEGEEGEGDKAPSSVKEKLAADPALSLSWPTSKIASKMSKMQKILGLTDEQLREAIEAAKREDAGYDPNEVGGGDEGTMSLSQKVDVVVYACLFLALIYFGRRDFGPQGARVFRSYFPREAEALGIRADIDEVVTRMKVHNMAE
eukprot:CAMPEP_0182488272 /NCGR_PEP_ID=MMETSP1319-20130603/48327_1 /TAXON_ID=172717 /ORGANISM="Bolidomonas pacifica, Strain RCC208" /LENGTH=282 /DNA_ID=CAMNT_0024690399 /DNA_START=206 /DNA_END=1054 /DNA_ORIENTATION=+